MAVSSERKQELNEHCCCSPPSPALQSPIEYQRRESKSNSLGRSMRPPLSAASALRPHSSASIDRHKLPSLHSHNTSLPALYLPSHGQVQCQVQSQGQGQGQGASETSSQQDVSGLLFFFFFFPGMFHKWETKKANKQNRTTQNKTIRDIVLKVKLKIQCVEFLRNSGT